MLLEVNPAAARRARQEIQGATRRFMWMPTPGRPSTRWSGCRELSLLRWRKIIVFKVFPDRLSVLALLDARQDLDAIKLPTE